MESAGANPAERADRAGCPTYLKPGESRGAAVPTREVLGMVAVAWRPRGPRREAFPPLQQIRGPMSRAGSSRRDQRRRMIVSWSRTAATPADSPAAAEGRRGAEYAPAAVPERQPALATFLPTGIGSLSLAALGSLLIAAATAGPSLAEMLLERPLFTPGGRFAPTLAALQRCLAITTATSLAAWAAQMLLVAAALVAWAVRGMRRHRRDDYNGRFRAWGWMAAALFMMTLAGQVPLGGLVAAFVADATGIGFGPSGLGWWVALTAITVMAISLWAVLPLHERLGTALWLGAATIFWGISAGCTWALAAGHCSDQLAIASQAAWAFAAATVLIAMLAAARSVIREIRGEAAAPAARRAKKPTPGKPALPDDSAADDEASAEADDHVAAEQPVVFVAAGDEPELADDSEFVDGSGEAAGGRKLTKAERKRLKRMARLQQAG